MNSSYTGEALGRAGRGVQEGLDAQRAQYLYGEQKEARTAKQGAIDNILKMSTFGYDKSPGEKSPIDQILDTLGPQAGEWFADFLKTKRGGGSSDIGNMAINSASTAARGGR